MTNINSELVPLFGPPPAYRQLALTTEKLVQTEASYCEQLLRLLIPIGEAALAQLSASPAADPDDLYDLADAIELSQVELSIMQEDPYYACSHGHDFIRRLAYRISDPLCGHGCSQSDFRSLLEVARSVFK